MKLGIIDHLNPLLIELWLKYKYGVEVDKAYSFKTFEEKYGSLDNYDGFLIHSVIVAELILNDILEKYPNLKLAIGSWGGDESDCGERIKKNNKLEEIPWPIFNYGNDLDEIVKYFKGE